MTHASKRAGIDAEARVTNELAAAGWPTETSAQLDYVAKTDVRTVCGGRRQFLVQVSLGPKSVGEQARLEARGVISLSVAALDGAGVTAPQYVCDNFCARELCAEAQTPLVINEATVDLTSRVYPNS
jgi:hypothetical protein